MVVALIVYFDNSVDLSGILLLGFEYFVVGVGLACVVALGCGFDCGSGWYCLLTYTFRLVV